MVQIPKVSFEETLGKHVLPSSCIGCASCVVVCPFNCLEYIDEKPFLARECKSCGICAQVCPRYDLFIPELEKNVYNRERMGNEDFGIYRKIVLAQTTDQKIRNVCQDGGVVTALLIYALNEGYIDGAVLSGVNETEPLKAVPKLATTAKEILDCAGTRYTYSPNMIALKEGIIQKKKKLAFVGTPDQIQAIRKIQALPLKKFSEAVALTIGVFCSECFTYEGLIRQLLHSELGINAADVAKINIKGKLLVTTKSGDVKEIQLKEAKKHVRNCIAQCSDFSSELADMSVGGLGLESWTLTVLRTEKAEELFWKANSNKVIRTRPIEDEKALDLLVKLSRRKRVRAIC
ncbi:MAG: Coenzyme F420 hydrogenase/dehydrogenase, beta subunit C-terminal domain [Candidatus Bathyarchaeia archaeon]